MNETLFRHIDMTPYSDVLRHSAIDYDIMGLIRKAAVRMAEDFDAFLADGILEELKKEGYTDLYLVDRKFVIDAIKEKVERERTE